MKKQLFFVAFFIIIGYFNINAQCYFQEDSIPVNYNAKLISEASNGW